MKLGGNQPILKEGPGKKYPNIIAYIYDDAARTKVLLDKIVAETVDTINMMDNYHYKAMLAPLKA